MILFNMKASRKVGGGFYAHRKLLLAAGAVSLCWQAPAWSDDSWVGATGDWNNPANWSGGIPTSSSVADINNGGQAQIGGAGETAIAQNVNVGPGSISLSDGLLTVGTFAGIGVNGTGSFIQSGGTLSLTQVLTGLNTIPVSLAVGELAPGTYSMSGGLIDCAGSMSVGENHNGTGSFMQTAGSVQVGVILFDGHGAPGNYTLTQGSINTQKEEVIADMAPGSFLQNGGINTTPNLALAFRGNLASTYNLVAGTLDVGSESVGAPSLLTTANAQFNQSGGTNSIGTLALYASNIPQSLYSLSAGTLTASGGEFIGNNLQIAPSGGFSNFTQSGGSNSTPSLVVGGAKFALATTAAYTLAAGTLAVTQSATLGGGTGLGSLVQSGGFFTAASLVVNTLGTFTQSGGTASIGSVTNAGPFTIGTAASLVVNSSYLQTAGQTQVNGKLTLQGPGTITGGSFQLGGSGLLDITNNSLAISFSSPASDPVGTIAADLKQGYNGGAWTGTAGIVSSTAAAGAPLLSVGYADGNLDSGTPAGPNQILVMLTKAGDANLDGVVNITDLNIVAANYGLSGGARWAQGDFDYDGDVNLDDLKLLLSNYAVPGNGANVFADPALLADSQAVSLLQSDGFTVNSLPEPGAISLAWAGAGLLLARRRRARSGDFTSERAGP